MPLNPRLADPTGTGHLRKQALASMAARFRALRSAIWQHVAAQDGLGLEPRGTGMEALLGNAAQTFEFTVVDSKVAAFQAWLRQQVVDGLLEVVPSPGDLPGAGPKAPWLAAFVRPAYKKGLLDAFGAAPGKVAGGAYAGSRAKFLREAFDAPVAVGKLATLYTRNFLVLKGMTDAMDAALGRILAEGLANGHGPYKVARRMVAEVDNISATRAKVIARTELANAHANGTLDGYEAMAVGEVEVFVEWLTAAQPCPVCSALKGIVMTIQQARGLLPRHPNCRCAFIPAVPGHSIFADKGSKWGAKATNDALRASLIASVAERGRDGKVRTPAERLAMAKARSSWAGKDIRLQDHGSKKPTKKRVAAEHAAASNALRSQLAWAGLEAALRAAVRPVAEPE